MNKLRKVANRIKKANKPKLDIQRLDTSVDGEKFDRTVKKVINLLSYTRKREIAYSATEFDTGYHSLNILGHQFSGQRNPRKRFEGLPISLKGKSVLDIGCNQGGMLHTFADDITWGVGIDYDNKMINVANKIKSVEKNHHLDFYVFDLENENLDYFNDFIPGDKVDVVFLLSVCMWIKNWKSVILKAKEISLAMIFETNGKDHVQQEQINFLKKNYKNVEIVTEKSDDDPKQKNRKLFYCY